MQTSSRRRRRRPAAAAAIVAALGVALAMLSVGAPGANAAAAARGVSGAHGRVARGATTMAAVPIVTTRTISGEGAHPSPYRFSVTIPVLRGGTPAASRRIDADLAASARRTVAAFARGLPKGPLPKGTPETRSMFTGAPTTSILTGRLVSFTTLDSSFQAGAAHPIDVVSTATFNATTGAPYRLAGLFRAGSDDLAVLSLQSRILVRRQLGSVVRGFVDAGTTPKATNFQGWALTPFGLQLTFSDYQVGPYVVGTPSVVVPFAALRAVARPGGPIALAEAARPARFALLPATTPPAVPECYQPPTNTSSPSATNGVPNTCRNGDLNVAAWNQIAGYAGRLLGIGAGASAHQVLAAVCSLRGAFGLAVSEADRYTSLAATYYGWPFSAATALNGYPARCPAAPPPPPAR